MQNIILSIALDKLRHWVVGSLLCLLYIPYQWLNINTIYSFLTCLLIATGYELYQYMTKKGKFEIKDILFTMISPLITYLILLM